MTDNQSEIRVTSQDNGLDLHQKARKEKGGGYPDRFPVPDDKVDWSIEWPEYNPVYYVAQSVLDNDRTKKDGGWADPEIYSAYLSLVDAKYRVSYENVGVVMLDKHERPLNPKGRTGITGRGLLGNWGPNNAVDPIVTTIDSEGYFRIIAIKRKDADARGMPLERALPGGMVDAGERVTTALSRELGEETNANLNFDSAEVVYRGYVDDPRNTDNAWMETEAYYIHLDSAPAELKASDDADEAGWFVVDEDFLSNMYASHSEHVLKAISMWEIKTGQNVGPDGKSSQT